MSKYPAAIRRKGDSARMLFVGLDLHKNYSEYAVMDIVGVGAVTFDTANQLAPAAPPCQSSDGGVIALREKKACLIVGEQVLLLSGLWRNLVGAVTK